MNPFSDYLNSINKTKQDIVRGNPEGTYNPDKDYPSYIFNKLLSYHLDMILLVGEINLHVANIPKLMEYDFLRETAQKRSRFSKLEKSKSKKDQINLIMNYYNCSPQKAEEIILILGEKSVKNLEKMLTKGGKPQ